MKNLFITLSILGALLAVSPANAQSVDWDEVVQHTLREEKEGKELFDKLQAKEIACADLGNEQLGVLGEYFMGQMTGESHAAMNAMMIQMHGEEGEEQIHIVMGKRLSGCETSAAFPAGGVGWMPMMQMVFPLRQGYGGQGGGWGWGGVGWGAAQLLWLAWLVAAVLAAVWLWKRITKK